jgi:hypothetical protein
MTNATVGQKVLCNGFEGRITAVCTGQLKGMVEVRLASGTVCVGLSDAGLSPISPTRDAINRASDQGPDLFEVLG